MMRPLKEELIERIAHEPDGIISFRDYMELALYHPQDGYYMRSSHKIGKEGDYYTSSSVHPVYAETIARFALELTRLWNRPLSFCEMGAGTGRFARQFLDALETNDPAAYQESRYLIVEKSPFFKKQQEELLGHHRQRVRWTELPAEPEESFEGFLFSNELVDAMPVFVVEKREGQWYEIGVSYDRSEDRFVERRRPLVNQNLIHFIKELQLTFPEGQRLEISLEALRWVRQVSTWMKAGLWLTVDYGYRLDELTEPRYRQGTLRSFHQHQVDDDVYDRPGQKDITADVCFDLLSREARLAKWQEVGLYSQIDFLLMAGILNGLEEHLEQDPFHPLAKKNRAIRHLLSPEGISGSFSVLVLAKGMPDTVLNRFSPFSIDEMIKKGY